MADLKGGLDRIDVAANTILLDNLYRLDLGADGIRIIPESKGGYVVVPGDAFGDVLGNWCMGSMAIIASCR